MTDFLAFVSVDDVQDPVSFARYCQQQLGVPFPTGKRMIVLRKCIREFFANNPKASYGTLTRIVQFCQSRSMRFSACEAVLTRVGHAFKAGSLPELQPDRAYVDVDLENNIEWALRVEPEPDWRNRLLRSEGMDARREVYNAWVTHRSFNFQHQPALFQTESLV